MHTIESIVGILKQGCYQQLQVLKQPDLSKAQRLTCEDLIELYTGALLRMEDEHTVKVGILRRAA